MVIEAPGPSSHQMEQLLPSPQELRRQSVKVVNRESRRRSLKGPLRALRLCVLSIVLPGLLVAVPLYMRYHVYGDQLYPMGMSDMRLLDARVSTTWCQRQLVHANATFNAFLLPEKPQIQAEPVHLSMTRHLVLEDDMKEYWAFYLLRGSSITVSTCARWPGASLIVIRGHKHLHDCAYIGDDSSEELEELELLEAELGLQDNSSDARSKGPETVRRARPGVVFHADPLVPAETLAHDSAEEDADAMLGKFLDKIAQARSKTMPQLARGPTHRGLQKGDTPRETISTEKDLTSDSGEGVDTTTKESREKERPSGGHFNETSEIAEEPSGVTGSLEGSASAERKATREEVTTSSEVFEEVLKKLQNLGPRGKGVLKRLNKKLGGDDDKPMDDGLDALRQMVHSLLREQELQEQKPTRQRHGTQQEQQRQREVVRRRRQIMLSSSLREALGEDDDEDNVAFEDDLEPDGIADHHQQLNETTDKDLSKSEFWSSFSSSEEALLSCAGLILNLPLTPSTRCEEHRKPGELTSAAAHNMVTYSVPANGYYFFVFNSENEVSSNFIHAHFKLKKLVYNVSHPLAACHNSTQQCSLPLHFFSSEKVVLEVPVRANSSLWNEEFVAVSTCEPRTALYLACVIAVPLLILLFAFQ